MGSFDVACAVTGLTIHDFSPAVFIPLERTWRQAHNQHPWGIITMDGAMSEFHAVALPIKGFYNDYGRLDTDNLADSKYWDFVKQNGHAPAREYFYDRPPHKVGTWVHRDVYEELASGLLASESGWPQEPATRRVRVSREVLVKLGFELFTYNVESRKIPIGDDRFIEYDNELGAYFRHQDLPPLIVYSDGLYGDRVNCTYSEDGSAIKQLKYVYSISDFGRGIKERFGYTLDTSFFDSITTRDWRIELVHQRLLGDEQLSNYMEPRFEAAMSSLYLQIQHRPRTENERTFKRAFEVATGVMPHSASLDNDKSPLDLITLEQLKSRELDKEVSEFATFIENIGNLNVMLRPSWCRMQHGNDPARFKLHEVVESIMYRRMT